jgi:hypothetical protein
MNVRFEEITLDTDLDFEARLVFRDNRLAAIVSRLSEFHDEFSGHWFVEAVFDGKLRTRTDVFPDLTDVEMWVSSLDRLA